MILRYTNGEGAEWLVSAPAETVEEARAMVEQPRSPDSPSQVDSNGGGPWEFDIVEHEGGSFPWERQEPYPNA